MPQPAGAADLQAATLAMRRLDREARKALDQTFARARRDASRRSPAA